MAVKESKIIRTWILKAIAKNKEVVQAAQKQFQISRQAVHKHLKKLESENLIKIEKQGKRLLLSLITTVSESWEFKLSPSLEENKVYQECIYPLIKDLPKNVIDIWHYGFTEMVNNAIDHSGGDHLSISLDATVVGHRVVIADDGEGIFAKIQKNLHLHHPQEAILELAKGKLTTDPKNHSGEGIFFTSRMFDYFVILSGHLRLVKSSEDKEHFLFTDESKGYRGTGILLQLFDDCERQAKAIFDEYVTEFEEYAFSRTVVPVALAQYEGQNLISRSQAKRVYSRFEKFKNIVLDFKAVDMIGQAFADELFRVFVAAHPGIELTYINANEEVCRMIRRAQSQAVV